jgi:NAD(P)-dependent dehydrogenase (short-subunit alcohol dehydrogenase family)
MFNLTGKVAFVTGASKGFGQAIAKTLAQAGADLALFARSADGLSETAQQVQAEGRKALILIGDVTQSQEVDSAVAKTITEFGRLDILVNNAGMNIRRRIEDFTDAEWYQVINTNLNGPFYCTRAVVPQMKLWTAQ